MVDKELDNYMKTVNPNFDSHIEKGTIEMSNEYYNLLEEKMARLINENQELKKHLKVPKACNLKALEDYKSYYEDTTREKILEDTYIEYCAYVNLAHRYSKLEKQLEQYQEEVCILDMRTDENIKYKNQQKEFIKYLEDEKDRLARECSNIYEDSLGHTRLVNADKFDEVNDILQKYKEIIGDVKNEN